MSCMKEQNKIIARYLSKMEKISRPDRELKAINQGCLGVSAVKHPPSAQVMIPGS